MVSSVSQTSAQVNYAALNSSSLGRGMQIPVEPAQLASAPSQNIRAQNIAGQNITGIDTNLPSRPISSLSLVNRLVELNQRLLDQYSSDASTMTKAHNMLKIEAQLADVRKQIDNQENNPIFNIEMGQQAGLLGDHVNTLA